MTDLTWTVSLQYPVIPPCPESRRACPDPDLALIDCQAAQTDAASVLSYTHKHGILAAYIAMPTKNLWHSLARLSEMPTSIALPTSHHFHPSISPIVSLSSGILHQWMRTQMLAKPPSNLLRRTRGGRAQLGWRTFMITCLCWILRYMRLEILCKIGLSGDWCLCTALHTRSGAWYYWIGHITRTYAVI